MSETILRERKTVRFPAITYSLSLILILFRYSILPAISLDGIIECMIVEGSFNTEIFMRFIEDLLDKMQPFPAPKSVIIMDNCAIHKAPEIRELVEGR